MNGESTATPAAEESNPKGPAENLEAAKAAFQACSEALAGLHPNDVKKTLNALSVMHFGR